jgi:hypothetical protein
MAQKKVSKTRKLIQAEYENNELAGLKQNQSRARALTVGTTTGGLVEVNMRGDYANLWYILHPVEAVEIMEQLAAACGVQIAMRPKQDFSAWRSWDTTLPASTHWLGSAPGQIDNEQRELIGKIKAKNIQALQESKDDLK